MDREEQSLHIQHGYEAAREKKIKGLQDKVREQADRIAELEEAARRVLSADMAGVRDIDALNTLEDATGFSQQDGT